MSRYLLVTIVFSTNLLGISPGQAADFATVFKKRIIGKGVVSAEHRKYVLARIPKLDAPLSAKAWQKEAAALRTRVLDDVVFKGVPESWRKIRKPNFKSEGTLTVHESYVIHKLRIEALPGLWIPALLYAPTNVRPGAKIPAVLNVNGHDPKGKSTKYKQLRCINLAKRGMLALNLEWLGMGQLRSASYSHNHLAKLDLCGHSGLSVFYLAMRCGLDVLVNHPRCDPKRVAVTGLSGGGWQTIILSSLDTRVTLTVPVAGYSALKQRVVNTSSIGDLEQNPTDLVGIADYAHLTAMMVPRPTLLIYNDKDNCCFRSSTVKPNTYIPVVPFFQLANVQQKFEYYENTDPGTHNYELDNRQQLYRFLKTHFGVGHSKEIPSDKEIQSATKLSVKLPKDNANFHTLAAQIATKLPTRMTPKLSSDAPRQRRMLRRVLRYDPLSIQAKKVSEDKAGTIRIVHWKMQLGKDWTLPVIVVHPNGAAKQTVLFAADGGMDSQVSNIETAAKAGTRVICVDLSLFGRANPSGVLYQNAQLIATIGKRPLGIQVAQFQATCEHFAKRFKNGVSVQTDGPRTGLVALCAAALDGQQSIAKLKSASMPSSLKEFLGPFNQFNKSPEVYCFGLLQHFDIPQLRSLAAMSK